MKATMRNTIITDYAERQMTEIGVTRRQVFSIVNCPAYKFELNGRIEVRRIVDDKNVVIFYTIQCKEFKVARIEEIKR